MTTTLPIGQAIDQASASVHTIATPVRVLHVINGQHFAGAERVQDLLAMRLGEFGFEVEFACLKPDQFPRMRRSQQNALHLLPMRGKFDLRPVRDLARLARERNAAIIHTHTARSALLGALAARWAGVPLVHHVHSPAAADTTQRLRNWANAKVETFSVRQASEVIAVSAALANYVAQRKLTRGAAHVVCNGVPCVGDLTERAIPGPTWTVGVMALFRPRKGLEMLLDAVAARVATGDDLRIHAVGAFETPDYEAEIMRRVARLGLASRIEWRGFRQDIAAELAMMDLFVLPSLFGEGLPMVILEAMAAGVPVVATRVAGAPEAIRDGVDGLLAEPGDAVSLADSIGQFVNGNFDWRQVRQSAHRRQAERFSDRSMAAGVAAVYREVLGT
ncbi:MAG: glycosyltransferase [Planctomycetes bacterium]|nr:glycosyltransferase [Planctomycetota bacterium]